MRSMHHMLHRILPSCHLLLMTHVFMKLTVLPATHEPAFACNEGARIPRLYAHTVRKPSLSTAFWRIAIPAHT